MRSGTAVTDISELAWERESSSPVALARRAHDGAPAGLFESAVELVRGLGLDWSGSGAGIYRCELDDGQSAWRAHSDWGGTGTIVDFDLSGDVVLQVQPRAIDHVGCGLRLPPQLRPSEDDVLAFVRAKLDVLAWPWPPLLFAAWDVEACSWRVRGESVAQQFCFEAEVHGVRDRLCLARIWRT